MLSQTAHAAGREMAVINESTTGISRNHQRGEFHFRELGDFFRQTVDLTASLFNLVEVDLRVGSNVHG